MVTIYTDISFIFIATLSLISVSYQAGPIEELVQYKKIVLYEEENSAFAGMVYTLYFRRLLIPGLPADISRPAIFIAVGQPSFTALAFIGMAKDVTATKIFSTYITLTGVEDQTIIPDGLQLLALIAAVFLWALAFWFLSIALVATIEAVGRNSFHLNWYAYIFPNVGFTITTIKIWERLDSPAITLVGTAVAAVLFFLWILIVVCHVRATALRDICWPGKDEDAH